ncbi:hypothetical protein IV417_05025 [Alphaproteobacteria bacterium KMM 3653]|uniref:Uncharacterized protein n=1 Tax=Harenicola maris TaxID=2841044 RepID=A0AAP2CLR6_9RHOB|nr:hypothetical protein [Harenicola maris]
MPLMPYDEAVEEIRSNFSQGAARSGVVNYYGAQAASNYPHLHVKIDGTKIVYMGLTYGPGGPHAIDIVLNGVLQQSNLPRFLANLPSCNVPMKTQASAMRIVNHVGAPTKSNVITGEYNADFPGLGQKH